jgi:parallel beta-helix repeat protein
LANFTLDPDVTDCTDMTANNSIYTLTADIVDSLALRCMNFSSDVQNTTLDCGGHNIDGKDTGSSYGVYATGVNVKNNTVQNCNITDWTNGIYLTSSSNNNTLTNNTANSNGFGFYLYTSSNNNTLTNNTANSNGFGFYLLTANNNTLTNNTANSNDFGLYISSSNNNTLTNNTITSSHTSASKQQGLYFDASSISTLRHNISESNKINGLPILYMDGINRPCPNNTVYTNGSLYGYMGFVGCNNITVTNSSPTDGIMLGVTSNSTISNLNISFTRYAIYLSGSNNNTLTNNTASSNSNNGFYIISSSSNTLTNNTANSNTYGFALYTSSSNTITNGSVALSTIDYFLSTTGTTNNFTNTNFTAQRKIQFVDVTSYFNYANDSTSNLWLKTNVSIAKTISRTLNKWSQTNMSWNDNVTATTATAKYNLTGLLANTQYSVYNGTVLEYTLTTDSIGQINFTINLNTTTRYIEVSIPVYLNYSSNSTNSTIAGSLINHSLYWQSSEGLSGYIFSFCNGSFSNQSSSQNTTYYPQTITANITGFNTSSPSNLNAQDGVTYNLTENQSGTVAGGVTNFVSYYNFSLSSPTVKAYGQTQDAGTGSTNPDNNALDWTRGWVGTNLTAGAYSALQTGGRSANFTNVNLGNNVEPFGRFNFTIAEPITDITWIFVSMTQKEYASMTESCYYYIANFVAGSWDAFATATSSATDVVGSSNLTSSLSNYIDPVTKQLVILSWGVDIDNGEGCAVNDVNVTIGYSTTTTAPVYRAEVEHNATGVSYTGTINNITASINFTTNVTSTLNMTIYNFKDNLWNSTICNNGTATANTWYSWSCNATTGNPAFYNSSTGVIRVRLNGTSLNTAQATIREDNVNFTVSYQQTTVVNYSCSDSSAILTNDTWASMTGIGNWSNVTKIVNSTVGSTIKWCYYANDTSNNWNGSSCTTPFSYLTTSAGVSDATWNLSMPSNYASWTSISGTAEGSATVLTYIGCNFSDIPQNWVQPSEGGNFANNQSGILKPIFYIDNTGTGAMDFSVKLGSNLPYGANITGNASCSGTYTSCQTIIQNITTTYTKLITGLSQTTSFGNITLYCGASKLVSSGQSSGVEIYLNGSLT